MTFFAFRDGVPCPWDFCSPSAETGEGKAFAAEGVVLASGTTASSSSGSTASLLGCGVSCVFLSGAVNLLPRGLRGDVRSGNFCIVEGVGVGVLEKNPRRDFWPLAEPDFLRDAGPGVLDGALLLGGMLCLCLC
jgi:hypothetical protein